MRKARRVQGFYRPLTHTPERRVTTLTRKVGKDDEGPESLEGAAMTTSPVTCEDRAETHDEAPVTDTMRRIEAGLAYIEAHLFERPSLAAIAQSSGVSPWHFHRVFVALTGETPASYTWKRQLAEICRRLVETGEPLVDVALDTGFESQASFTRAFTRHVGVSPARYRRAGVVSPTYRYAPLDVASLVRRRRWRETMEPRIVRRPAFHAIGRAGRFTPATTSRIAELWEGFVRGPIDAVPHRRGRHTLGLCLDADPATVEQAGFTYVAAVEVEHLDVVPPGMVALTVPASTYAVFTHHGHISRLPDTVKQVWGHALPASPFVHVPTPDFELYDERWDPTTGEGDIDLYVPIAEPTP
jgi:AraC family transcriptional regulator